VLAPKSLRGMIAACLTPFRDGRVDFHAHVSAGAR
jgi:dihydrodipicolinate synthase/N-acetylneuraminate lyase